MLQNQPGVPAGAFAIYPGRRVPARCLDELGGAPEPGLDRGANLGALGLGQDPLQKQPLGSPRFLQLLADLAAARAQSGRQGS